jgi:hypothetical protein
VPCFLFLETLMPFSSYLGLAAWRARRRQTGPFVHADDTRLSAHPAEQSPSDADELLRAAIDALDPTTASFGCDVADFIDTCVSQRILTFDAPVTGIRIEPTVLGERRDGGFLVLVTVGHVTTVTSQQLSAELFRSADDIAALVLAAVRSTANSVYRALLSTAADLPRSRS